MPSQLKQTVLLCLAKSLLTDCDGLRNIENVTSLLQLGSFRAVSPLNGAYKGLALCYIEHSNLTVL